jgi:hypothetical protein
MTSLDKIGKEISNLTNGNQIRERVREIGILRPLRVVRAKEKVGRVTARVRGRVGEKARGRVGERVKGNEKAGVRFFRGLGSRAVKPRLIPHLINPIHPKLNQFL